jgi:hypothetical protein
MILIVPLHDDQTRLEKFVACLNQQTVKPFVLWVDNGTKDCKNCVVKGYTGFARCLPITSHSYSRNYWSGCLKTAQEWILDCGNINDSDTVGIINNDVTFAPNYFQTVHNHCQQGEILSSLIIDAETNEEIQKGVMFLWGDIFSRDFGAIPTISTFVHKNIEALRDCGLFLKVSDFHKIKFHPWLLPHYCGDYAWTNKLIKGGMKVFVPNTLKLHMDFTTTGITDPKSIRELFSITCPHNPIFYTIFILMCCPWKWKLPNIIRVWGYATVRAIRILKGKQL